MKSLTYELTTVYTEQIVNSMQERNFLRKLKMGDYKELQPIRGFPKQILQNTK